MGKNFGGFGGFGGGNMQAMMRQAQKMQQDALKAKEELDNSVYEGSASGGLVKVELTGAFEMQSIKIDPSVVDSDDVEMLEDLIVAAYNDAKSKAEDDKAQKMGAFGGLI
jgi:DNA-binding YbaB/EbfC family protein